MDDANCQYKLFTNEYRIHEDINVINAILKREVLFNVTLNKLKLPSTLEFEGLESFAQVLKDTPGWDLANKESGRMDSSPLRKFQT
jgi:hypothetical protein